MLEIFCIHIYLSCSTSFRKVSTSQSQLLPPSAFPFSVKIILICAFKNQRFHFLRVDKIYKKSHAPHFPRNEWLLTSAVFVDFMANAKPKTCNYDPKFMATKPGKRASHDFRTEPLIFQPISEEKGGKGASLGAGAISIFKRRCCNKVSASI